jgi:hypothetical protein
MAMRMIACLRAWNLNICYTYKRAEELLSMSRSFGVPSDSTVWASGDFGP